MEIEAKYCGVTIKSFGGDNRIFKSAEFRLEIKDNNQKTTYYLVRVHHQNDIVESYIRTIIGKSRTDLLNAHIRWPKMVSMELLKFALRHIVTKWNNTPRPNLK